LQRTVSSKHIIAMLGSKVLLLIPCLCFGVIVLKWKQSGEPSIASLEMQLSNLQRQLQGFDKLKEDYVREEIELGWDRQHLTELKDRRAELSNSLAQMSDAFKEGARNLRDNNSEMARALAAMHAHNVKMRTNDMKTIQHLKDEAAIVHEKVHHEREENADLKEILGEIRSLLDIEKANAVTQEGLRGSPKPNNSS
jgi:DNA repair exonuclease SbcCD ATPase subunit